MNTNLLNIINRIVSEKGENILSDAQKLNPLFKDYAKDEPKEERAAFGRCIEMGAYYEIKNSTPADRAYIKSTLISNLQNITGYNTGLCSSAVNLLEAVVFGIPNVQQSSYNFGIQSGGYNNYNYTMCASNTKKSSIAKTGFIIGIINIIQILIIYLNRENIYLPEQEGSFIIIVWLILTFILAITGLMISKKGYDEKSDQIFGVIGMALNGIVILPVIFFIFLMLIDAHRNKRYDVTIHKNKW